MNWVVEIKQGKISILKELTPEEKLKVEFASSILNSFMKAINFFKSGDFIV